MDWATPAKVAEAVSFASSLGVSDWACSWVQGEEGGEEGSVGVDLFSKK